MLSDYLGYARRHTNVQERSGWVQECSGCRTPKNMVGKYYVPAGTLFSHFLTMPPPSTLPQIVPLVH